MFTSDTKQEDGTLKWLNTSSQKETVSTSSTFRKTVKKVEEAYYFVRDIAASGEDILFVGTKKQAQDSIKEEAERVGMYYVNARWLGGMLTNFKTIQKRIERLAQINQMEEDGTFDMLPKKEVIKLKARKR